MRCRLPFLLVVFLLAGQLAGAQTLGGRAAYSFLHLPSSPLLTAAGGVNVSYNAGEAGLSANQPALLQPSLHGQLNASFNSFPGAFKTYSAAGAWHQGRLGTTFGAHVYFVDYGSIPQTDASGNISGTFRPVDYVVQLSAGRRYLQRWQYGVNLKLIRSAYEQYRSTALALDVGLLYTDSAAGFTAGLLAKNMGAQLASFTGEREDLPFDLQIGITKRLARSPFGFSLTARQVHRFNIAYNDTSFNQQNDLPDRSGFFNNLLNHFVLASHIYLGSHLEATIGYNYLRRQELSLGSGNGLTGFSAGLRVRFEKLQILYARSTYQPGQGYNQLGVTVQLSKLGGLGE
jgi:hypothetical protein